MDETMQEFIRELIAFDEVVSIFLINGIKLRGKITDFGANTIILSKTQAINLNAISTIQNEERSPR